jgi:NAD(P)-dependent dehydrogenase (short-subunit alcohol dehydrogenase family)
MTGKLEGRVALITGAARGIGQAIAERYVAEGARIVIADILGDLARETAEVIGDQALGLEMDVTNFASVSAAVDEARQSFGPIDVLVNNAAALSGIERKPSADIKEAEWDRVMAINVKGIWQTVRATLPDMQQKGYGKIINISSDVVFSGVSGLLHYTASKGAVMAMTRSLASELGPDGICVNSVAPGFTATKAALDHGGDALERSVAGRALQRVQVPDDLTGTMTYFASSDSDFVTGQLIVVNGGYTFH